MNNKLLIGRAAAYCETDNSIWYVGKNASFLFQVDLYKFEVVKMIGIPKLDNASGFDYINVIDDGDIIYIISYDAKIIVQYNKENEKVEVWKVPVEFEKSGVRRVYSAITFKENIYLIGCLDYKDIIVFNTVTREVKEIKNTEECNSFSYCCMLEDNTLIIPYLEKNKIMRIDLDNNHQDVIQIENNNEGYMDCVIVEDGYVFVTLSGRIVKFDKSYNMIWERNIYSKIFCVRAIQNNKIAVWGLYNEKVWLVSEYGEVSELNIVVTELSVFNNSEYSKFELVVSTKDKVLFQQRTTGEFYVLENECIKKTDIFVSESKSDEIYKSLKTRGEIYSEGEIIGCKEFLRMLS